jgi:hypothetical protein
VIGIAASVWVFIVRHQLLLGRRRVGPDLLSLLMPPVLLLLVLIRFLLLLVRFLLLLPFPG